MNSMYYRFSLDMHKVQSQISLPVSLGDTARTLYINFTDGGKPYYIEEGCLAKLTITRPSKSKLHEFCVIEGNTSAVYPFSQNEHTAIEEGIHDCEVTLYGRDGKQITSPRFSIVVSDRVVNMDDNVGIPDESIGIVDAIIHEEQARRVAEDGRVDAENNRALEEENREVAEESRVSAEAERVKSDTERVEAYKRIEYDTISSISKILSEQETIMGIQDELIAMGQDQERLAAIIELQKHYIGGGN